MEKTAVYPCPELRAEVLAGGSNSAVIRRERVFEEITWSECKEEAQGEVLGTQRHGEEARAEGTEKISPVSREEKQERVGSWKPR